MSYSSKIHMTDIRVNIDMSRTMSLLRLVIRDQTGFRELLFIRSLYNCSLMLMLENFSRLHSILRRWSAISYIHVRLENYSQNDCDGLFFWIILSSNLSGAKTWSLTSTEIMNSAPAGLWLINWIFQLVISQHVAALSCGESRQIIREESLTILGILGTSSFYGGLKSYPSSNSDYWYVFLI